MTVQAWKRDRQWLLLMGDWLRGVVREGRPIQVRPYGRDGWWQITVGFPGDPVVWTFASLAEMHVVAMAALA